jgi:hypothetical protein
VEEWGWVLGVDILCFSFPFFGVWLYVFFACVSLGDSCIWVVDSSIYMLHIITWFKVNIQTLRTLEIIFMIFKTQTASYLNNRLLDRVA